MFWTDERSALFWFLLEGAIWYWILLILLLGAGRGAFLAFLRIKRKDP
jgi:hypothetical protein